MIREKDSVNSLKSLLALLCRRPRFFLIEATPNQKGFWMDVLNDNCMYIGLGIGIIAIEGHDP
ncbi:hypothetical protein DYQ94_06545 [Xanthomonas sp. LMG 8993]|nr:hypothetical protein [Xanthomonas sp. LMG 8993]